MPLHRPTIGTIRSGLWAPDTPYSSIISAGALGDFSADKIILKLNTLAHMPHPTRARKLVKCLGYALGKVD